MPLWCQRKHCVHEKASVLVWCGAVALARLLHLHTRRTNNYTSSQPRRHLQPNANQPRYSAPQLGVALSNWHCSHSLLVCILQGCPVPMLCCPAMPFAYSSRVCLCLLTAEHCCMFHLPLTRPGFVCTHACLFWQSLLELHGPACKLCCRCCCTVLYRSCAVLLQTAALPARSTRRYSMQHG